MHDLEKSVIINLALFPQLLHETYFLPYEIFIDITYQSFFKRMLEAYIENDKMLDQNKVNSILVDNNFKQLREELKISTKKLYDENIYYHIRILLNYHLVRMLKKILSEEQYKLNKDRFSLTDDLNKLQIKIEDLNNLSRKYFIS